MLSPMFKFLPISLWANSLTICFPAQRRKFLGGIIFLVCGLAWSQNISATIIYVKSNAVGENNGSSWQDAYLDLQNALATANIGDRIWVAQGIYTPSRPNNTGDPRDVTFKLIDGVKIYGGFAGIIGSEELSSGLFQDQPVRNPNSYETILSGNIGISDSNTDNSYHVVTSDDTITNFNTLLDGFTITEGNANGGNNKDFGGGLYNSGGKLRLENLILKYNVATQCGGGIYNLNSTDLVLKAVKLTNNVATRTGGGMCNDNSSPQLNFITVISNSASDGGGIYNYNSKLVINGGYIKENQASNNGGGFYNQNTELKVTDNLINKVTIQSNQASLDGGGIYNNNSQLTIGYFSFEGNSATSNGGGLYDDATSYSSMHHTLFTGNKADNGGGWYSKNSNSILKQMTFSGNLAVNQGGGIYHVAGSLVVNNSILWNNADQEGLNPSQSAQIYFTGESPIVNYSIIQGGWSDITTNYPGYNKNADPRFVNKIDPLLAPQIGGDFHLTPGSSAADTGLNELLDGIVKDFEQKARIINNVVDMGPYEMQFPSVSQISCKHPKGCGNQQLPLNERTLQFEVTFSEKVTGLDETDLQLHTENLQAHITDISPSSGYQKTYLVTVTITEVTANLATLRLDVEDNDSITNESDIPLGDIGSGNGNFTTGEVYLVDLMPPTVTIEQASQQNDPTGFPPLVLTVTFSEKINGFKKTDINFNGSTEKELLTATLIDNNPIYTAAVNGMVKPGIVIATIDADVVTDIAGNFNNISTSTDNQITYKPTSPVVVAIEPNLHNPSKEAMATYLITFSEAVTGVDTTDFRLETDLMDAHIDSVTGEGKIYTVKVNTGEGEGDLQLNLVDDDTIVNQLKVPLGGIEAKNGNFKGGSYHIDRTAPTVKIIAVNPDPRDQGVPSILIQFSEAVTHFNLADLVLTRNGESLLTSSQNLTSHDQLTWQLDNLLGLTNDNGNYLLVVKATDIIDEVGNPVTADATETWQVSHEPFAIYASNPTPNSVLDFGKTAKGASTTVALEVTKLGSLPLTVELDQISGDQASDFKVITPQFPLTITELGGTATITVQCTPSKLGLRTAEVTLKTNDPARTRVSYPLKCLGRQPPRYFSDPHSESRLDFGHQPVGQSTYQQIRVEQQGELDLQVNLVAITGSHANDFIVTAPPFPILLTVDQPTQTIQLKCTTTTEEGLHTAVLQLATNDPHQPSPTYQLACASEFSGGNYHSTPPPNQTIHLGKSTVGKPITTTLIINKTGQMNLQVGLESLTGAHSQDFHLIDPALPFEIKDETETKRLTIQCTPLATGLRQAKLVLNSSDPAQLVLTYPLECIGTPPTDVAAIVNSFSPGYDSLPSPESRLNVGKNSLGNPTTTELIVLEVGSSPLEVQTSTITGPQATDFSISEGIAPFSLTATGTHSHTLIVQCIPSGLGQRQAYLTLTTNDPNRSQVNYELVCTGLSTSPSAAPADIKMPEEQSTVTQLVTTLVDPNIKATFSGQIQTSAGAVGSQLTIDAPEAITLIGRIQPKQKHLGKQADIIATYQWWSADDHSTLNLPIVVSKNQLLTPSLEFTLFQGNLIGLAGLFKVHLGYQINNQLLAGEIATLSVRSNRPPTDINLSAAVVAENSQLDTPIGKLIILDPDQGEWFKCGLIDDAGGRFKVIDNELRVANPYLIDFETARNHSITVKAVDASGESVKKSLLITVKDEIESNQPTKSSTDEAADPTPEELIISIFPKPEQIGKRADILMNYHWLPTHGEPFNWSSDYAQNLDLQPQMNLLIWQGSIKELSGEFIIEPAYLLANGELITQPHTRFNIKPNSIPYHLILSNNIVLETSPVGTLVGTLSVEPNLPNRYAHELIEDAAGQFTLINERIFMAAEPPLAHQQSAHSITVKTMDLQTGSELETALVIYIMPDNS